MTQQLSFGESEYQSKRHITRKEKFLGRMDKLIPWQRYRGLRKNHHKLAMLFALANIVRVDHMLRA